MTEKRFIIDDVGTLIDMVTRDTFDYVSDVVGLLNELHEENQYLKSLKWNQDCINEISIGIQQRQLLEKENEQLKKQLHYCKSFVVNNNGKDVQRIFFKSLEDLK